MDQERWARLQAIFAQVADLPLEARDAAMDTVCGGDAELRALLEQLLAEDGQASPLLDAGVAPAAERILGDGSRERFGPYVVVRKLDEGGMGVVYLAERPDIGQRVAIKVLGDAWVSPARRDRFTQEQQALARLNHPSIATLFDAATLADGTPYFVMEYVEGEHLTAHCSTRNLDVAARLRLFGACCEAVRHAHQHLLIHRDLKPSNIMVTPAGAVKLLDFGIAKEIEHLNHATDQTQAYRPLTPEYAAPEQMSGGQVGVFTDVYSLGVILYELLAERLPFERVTAAGDDTAAGEREPQPASLAARSTGRGAAASRSQWADLDVICAKALRRDRERRYQSVEALLRDVNRYLHGEPIEARPDSATYRAGKFIRRHVPALSAAAAAAAVIAALVAFYTIRLQSVRNAADSEAAVRERVEGFMLRLFDAGEDSAAPAADLRVLSLIHRGVREAESLGQDPRVQAELYLTLGQVYRRLGDMNTADALIRRSLDRRRALGASNAEIMESLVALGTLRLAQGQLPEAERLVRDGLRVGRTRPVAPAQRIGRATMALGQVLDARDDRAGALPLLEEALRIFDTPGPPTLDLSAALKTLANGYYHAGRLDDSERLNRRVLEIDRTLRSPNHPTVADALLNLGAIANDRGDYPASERLRRQALASFQTWYGPGHPETASAQMLLAQALSVQGRLDEASTLLHQALATQERVYGPTHPRVALVLNELGIVESRRTLYEPSEVLFTRAIAIFRQIYPAGHSRTAVAESNLATTYLLRKQFVRAEAAFQATLVEMAKVYPADHLNIGIARLKLGRALVGQKRFREAESPLTAGYRILTSKTSPSVTWLQSGREDLATVYDALGQPDKARIYRDEHASVERARATRRAS